MPRRILIAAKSHPATFTLFVVICTALLSVVGCQQTRLADFAKSNRDQIERLDALEKEGRDADVVICREVNRVLRADRRTLADAPKESARLLPRLGFSAEQIDTYLKQARRDALEELSARPLVARGKCWTLAQRPPDK